MYLSLSLDYKFLEGGDYIYFNFISHSGLSIMLWHSRCSRNINSLSEKAVLLTFVLLLEFFPNHVTILHCPNQSLGVLNLCLW